MNQQSPPASDEEPFDKDVFDNAPRGPRPPKPWLLVAWPSFLAACGLSMGVFAVVSPADLHWGNEALAVDATTAYSLAFFVFWAATAASGCVTAWLLRLPQPSNRD